MFSKNIFSAIMFFILHHEKERRNIIILGGSILAIGFIGMIITGSIVIQNTAIINLTSNGSPKTAILGISVYFFEYAFLYITIFGVFYSQEDGCKRFKEKTKKFFFELLFSNRKF